MERAPSTLLAESAIHTIADAVFAKPDPFVAEAYSEHGRKSRVFNTAADLADYIKGQLAGPEKLAYIFIVYSDMGGSPVRRTIHLDPKHCPGQKFRFTWDGFGLISLQLYGSDRLQMSRICSNSPARAKAWAFTCPDWSPPDAWNWRAVESHTRRLQRILKRSSNSQAG